MDVEGIVIFTDFLAVVGEGSYAIRTRLCSPNTLFSFVFFLKKGSFGLPFWHILETLGTLLAPRGCPGVVWEGSEKEVEKRGPLESYRSN